MNSSKPNKRNRLQVTSYYNSALEMLDEVQTRNRKDAKFYNRVIGLYNMVCHWQEVKQMGAQHKTASSLFYDPTEAWENGIEEYWVPDVLKKTRLGRVLLDCLSPELAEWGDYRDDLDTIGLAHFTMPQIWLVQLFLCGVSQTPEICAAWQTAEKNLTELYENEADARELAREFRKFLTIFDNHPFVEFMEREDFYVLDAFKADKAPKSAYLVLTSVFLKKELAMVERCADAVKHFDQLVKVVGAWRQQNNINPEDERNGDLGYWAANTNVENTHKWVQGTALGRALIRLVPEFSLPTIEIRESLIYDQSHVLATFLCAFPAKDEYKRAMDDADSTKTLVEYLEKLSVLFDLLAKDPAVDNLHRL